MSGYTKLFPSILDSTVWDAPLATKVAWITLLAMADRDGFVSASVPGLAKRAGVTREQCEEALAFFLAPDPDSRTREHDGRRIAEADGGWRLLNAEKYREKSSIEERRAKDNARQARKRERASSRDSHDSSRDVTPNHVTVTPSPSESAMSRHAEATASAEATSEAVVGSGATTTHSAIPRGASARKAYAEAVEAVGGIFEGGAQYRGEWRRAEAFAAAVVARDGGDAQDVLDDWAARYCADRQKRSPGWWLERVEVWASEGSRSAARADDWHPTQGPPPSAHHDHVWNLWIADGCPNDPTWKPRVAS